ncbi:hypothetical protein BS17DRAFT_810283 [Gyrodon lividus]|nr:hypothetical protein BS17DRAFT_810283 [Gyrodon lividus]
MELYRPEKAYSPPSRLNVDGLIHDVHDGAVSTQVCGHSGNRESNLSRAGPTPTTSGLSENDLSALPLSGRHYSELAGVAVQRWGSDSLEAGWDVLVGLFELHRRVVTSTCLVGYYPSPPCITEDPWRDIWAEKWPPLAGAPVQLVAANLAQWPN